MQFLKTIYRFLIAKMRRKRQQEKQAQSTEPKPTVPTEPPAKRVLITYGVFSLIFIVLAAAAWFFKGVDLLPEPFAPGTDTSNADIKPEADDRNTVVSGEHSSNKPKMKRVADLDWANELQDKVERLKDEIQQLDSKLNTARIKQYIASARYLMETRTAPEQALSLLQAARTDIAVHRHTSEAEMNTLSQDIDRQIARLQHYIAHSPRRALTLLNPLIEHLHTSLEITSTPQAEMHANTGRIDESWVKEWLNKIYAAGKTLIKVEHPDYQYIENNYVLFKLLITARSAVLLNEQEQFNIALKDALGLIENMPNPPISQEQIQAILSLEITWQLPTMQ